MREQIKDKQRLEHILHAIDIINEGMKQFDWEQIKTSPIIYFGFVKEVEIIGEATYMLSKEFKQAHSGVPWNKIEGMRHVLVHGYYAINPNHLKIVISDDLPKLRLQINDYLQELKQT